MGVVKIRDLLIKRLLSLTCKDKAIFLAEEYTLLQSMFLKLNFMTFSFAFDNFNSMKSLSVNTI